jgi:ribosome-binding factor A
MLVAKPATILCSSPRRINGSRGGSNQQFRSKRQERVNQLVQTELAKILHQGFSKTEYLEAELRQRISIVNINVSPDLKQARVSVSVRGPIKNVVSSRRNDDDDDVSDSAPRTASSAIVDRRRAYTWLVRNTKSIRHALAQRISHIKSCPTLTFVLVDVGAAVDVMYLIDQVATGSGAKRSSIDIFDGAPSFRDDDDEEDFDDDDDEYQDEDEDDMPVTKSKKTRRRQVEDDDDWVDEVDGKDFF